MKVKVGGGLTCELEGGMLVSVVNVQKNAHNSCKTLIGVHEMHGRMHPN